MIIVNEYGQILHANSVFEGWIAKSNGLIRPRSLPEILDSRLWKRYAVRFSGTVKRVDGVHFPLKTWLPCMLKLRDLELSIQFLLDVQSFEDQKLCLIQARLRENDSLCGAEVMHNPKPAEAISLPRARILLVEDSPDNTALIECYFRNTPLQLDHAANGLEAVKMVQSTYYDLVLMDLQMPVMDGYSATHEIRCWEMRQRSLSRLPIYALSAFTFRENIERALAVGMDGHFAKPIKRRVLLQEISRILQFRGRGFWNSMDASVAKS